MPVARAKGVYFWTPGRQALSRLQQPADVRQHRPRRRARRQRDRRSRPRSCCTRTRSWRPSRAPGSAPSSPRCARATSTCSSSPTAAPRPTRTRSRSRARSPAARRSWRAIVRITARRPRRSARPAIRGAGASRRCRASSTSSTRITASQRGWDIGRGVAARISRRSIQLEGPHTIAAFILEPVTGTNGILVPPDGYLQGVRALCDKHGILMIADEVMSGFGRTGEWFAVNHWNVVPDIITMAKGLTSAYVQLGAVGMRRKIADHFTNTPFPERPHLQQPPARLRGGAGRRLRVIEEDGLIDRARQTGRLMAELLADLAVRHPSVGAVRSIGLFGIVELVRNRTDHGADGAVQRHVAGDGGARRSSSATKGSTRSCAGTTSSRTRRCRSPKPSCARASRSSTARSISPIAPSSRSAGLPPPACTTTKRARSPFPASK